MGHSRLGKIPTTRQWKSVVELLTSQQEKSPAEDIENISRQSLNATEQALGFAMSDEGLRVTFFLLTKLAELAKERNWQQKLEEIGVRVTECESATDLCFAIQDAIDERIEQKSLDSDVSEIARQAAGDALHHLFQVHQLRLLGDDKSSVLSAMKSISSKKGYAELGHTFFSQFLSRFLNFYLSRATASSTGSDRFHQVGDVSEFNNALRTHCRQSSLIVRDFCGSWFSKTSFKEGITQKNSSGFLKVALGKISKELASQGRAQ